MLKILTVFVLLLSTIISCAKSYAKTQAKIDQAVIACTNTSHQIICMRKLAKNNNIQAQYNLALIYANAQGVKRNNKKAVYWFKQSAQHGYPPAQLSLAVYYYKGLGGLNKDYQKTIYWLTQSANQNYPPAKKLLTLTLAQHDPTT